MHFVRGLAVVAVVAAFVTTRPSAQNVTPLWTDVSPQSPGTSDLSRRLTGAHRTVAVDIGQLAALLASAPREFTADALARSVELELPWPDGGTRRFRIEDAPIMAPELAARFQNVKTYTGQGVDDGTASARFDWTPLGFHAMVLSAEGTVYVDPYGPGDVVHYLSYFRRDYQRDGPAELSCGVVDDGPPPDRRDEVAYQPPHGTQLRTYRLAVAATGEYTAFFGGTVPAALEAMTTTMNRVNGIFERDIAVRLTMIANTDVLIYTNGATDPYTNTDSGAMLTQNQANVDAIIGSANYDIGHVFSTFGGGRATLRSACSVSAKARGVSGRSSPTGDAFDADILAHEFGHQFGANHSFNGTSGSCAGNRNATTAWEPGSGSTIMLYSGSCSPENIVTFSDYYFHGGNQSEMITFLAGSGGACAVTTPTGNSSPVVSAGADYTIPIGTPFTLSATASDANGDPLTYTWEEMDLGTASPPNTDDGTRPIFRAFFPGPSPSRTFPKLSDVNGNVSTFGESLPATTRAMTFRVTARDNRANGGGTASDDAIVNVISTTGPFVVTAPNTAVNWRGGQTRTVMWNVADTTAAPVSAANVKVSLSKDGGLTYPYVLLATTPNDGAENIVVPDVPTSTARIKVEGAGNIFFDVSNANFTIGPAVPPVDLDGNSTGDVFLYSPSSGEWAFENTQAGGGFAAQNGAWGPGWTVTPATFNTDALTDVFLFNNSNGQWFRMLNNGAGGWTADGFAAWGTNWQQFLVDLNGDGLSDIFLWDSALGTWFKCLSTAGGFTYTQGFWSTGWEIYPMRFNDDALQDFFIFNRSNGQWFWVVPDSTGTFTFPQFAAWSPVWQFYPGDYNGDGVSDLLLHDPANGQYFIATTTAGNFTYSFGTFTTGWNIYPMDLDANGRTDLFLHNPTSGQWFEMMSNGAGAFTVAGNSAFGLGWDLFPTDFNSDGRGDLFLYNPDTGQWFQARNLALGSFSFSSGTWSPGLSIVVRPGRP